MKETGIIFSTDMVKAILNGTKTQTRRVIKLKEYDRSIWDSCVPHNKGRDGFLGEPYLKVPYDPVVDNAGNRITCPYGQVGDKLWVRETFWQDRRDKMICFEADHTYMLHPDDNEIMRNKYIGTANENMLSLQTNPHWKKKPSIHMPRWASRITLEITEVRVERVQEINYWDAGKEGLNALPEWMRLAHFHELWDSLNAKRGYGWDTNLWVWVLSFGAMGVRIK